LPEREQEGSAPELTTTKAELSTTGMRSGLFCTVLVACVLAVCAQLPASVNNGFFEGRSGDLLLKPNTVKDDSYLVFLGDNKVVVPKKELNLPETRVADLLSHLMGTAPLTPNVDRADFPKKGFFNNPKANLMFVLDSTMPGSELVLKHKIESEAYPDDSLAALTSILTGATPSQHGIIAEAWLDREKGDKVTAFESWAPSQSGSRSATLQDIFGLAFGGRSLTLSFSSKLQMARALSAKPFLLKTSSPNHGFFWSGKGFDSVYAEKSEFSANSQQLMEVLTRLQNAPVALNKERTALVVEGTEGQTELTLTAEEVMKFAAEVAYSLHLVELLSANDKLSALVSDDVPDFFTIGFSTLKDLQSKYGKASAEMKAVSVVVNYVMSTVVSKLSALYQGRLLAEAIFLGSNEEVASANQQQLLEKTRSTLVSQLADEEHLADYYPSVYLNEELSLEQKDEACSFLRQVLDAASVEVFCLPHPSHFRSLRADSNNTGDGTVQNNMETFHIVLWTSIVLILTTFFAAVVMFTIDASKDTMIYNQHSQIHIKNIS